MDIDKLIFSFIRKNKESRKVKTLQKKKSRGMNKYLPYHISRLLWSYSNYDPIVLSAGVDKLNNEEQND